MKRLPIFLWIFPELIQDNRWQQTHLARIPLEILVTIFQYKWLLERREAKKQLEEHFVHYNYHWRRDRELRNVSTLNFEWQTPNSVHVSYVLKWGPGFFTKNIIFTKNLKVKSQHTQYDVTNTRIQIRNNRNILPSVENRWGLPIGVADNIRYLL